MKKIIICLTIILISLISVSLCSDDYNLIENVNRRYDLNLPLDLEKVYGVGDYGFGDGIDFYVYNVDISRIDIEFKNMNDSVFKDINDCAATIPKIDESYILMKDHEYLYRKYVENIFKYLYIIYDKNSNYLIILNVVI